MIGRAVDNPIYIIGNITGASRVVIPKLQRHAADATR